MEADKNIGFGKTPCVGHSDKLDGPGLQEIDPVEAKINKVLCACDDAVATVKRSADTRRDKLAEIAYKALIEHGATLLGGGPARVAATSYDAADAMIAEGEKAEREARHAPYNPDWRPVPGCDCAECVYAAEQIIEAAKVAKQ